MFLILSSCSIIYKYDLQFARIDAHLSLEATLLLRRCPYYYCYQTISIQSKQR